MTPKTFFKCHPFPRVEDIQYYDYQKNWRRILKALKEESVQAQMVKDLNKFTWGNYRTKFLPGMLPQDADSCTWRLSTPRKERPAYWAYVTWSACHWVVNFNLLVAQRVEKDRPWRILTSPEHSTVWDGDRTLFDFNYCALDVPAPRAFLLATDNRYAEVFAPGQLRKVYCPGHYTKKKR